MMDKSVSINADKIVLNFRAQFALCDLYKVAGFVAL